MGDFYVTPHPLGSSLADRSSYKYDRYDAYDRYDRGRR